MPLMRYMRIRGINTAQTSMYSTIA